MRIALLPSAYAPAFGGVEELTARLAHQLVSEGHEVEVWVHRHPADLPEREIIDGIRVRRFAMALPAASVGSLARFPSAGTAALRAMGRAMRAFRPDVLHVQCFSVNGVYATALARLFGTPLIVSLQGETVMDDNDVYEHSQTLRLGLRLGLRRAAAVTGCSRFVLDDAVARFGLRAEAGIVVPNGVDLSEPVEPVALELPFERFILAMGRVVEKKGFDLLLDAFDVLADQHPDIGLVIGGEGRARPALMAQAVEMGLTARVAFPGRLSRGQVAWATRHAAAFVLPSRVEPFGIVVLEAMRGGAPVIVSANGGAQEIARDGVEGLAADPFDRDALAAAITRVLDDPDEAARLASAGRRRVREYDWRLVTARYLALYADASSS